MARGPFVSKAARAAGVRTEQDYLNWLAQQRGAASYARYRRSEAQPKRQRKIETDKYGWRIIHTTRKGYARHLDRLPPNARVMITARGRAKRNYEGRQGQIWTTVLGNTRNADIPDIVPFFDDLDSVNRVTIRWRE